MSPYGIQAIKVYRSLGRPEEQVSYLCLAWYNTPHEWEWLHVAPSYTRRSQLPLSSDCALNPHPIVAPRIQIRTMDSIFQSFLGQQLPLVSCTLPLYHVFWGTQSLEFQQKLLTPSLQNLVIFKAPYIGSRTPETNDGLNNDFIFVQIRVIRDRQLPQLVIWKLESSSKSCETNNTPEKYSPALKAPAEFSGPNWVRSMH